MTSADLLFEKGLPANLEVERMILGAIMLNTELYVDVSAVLEAVDFSLEKHRRIFGRMTDLYERGEKIDRLTLVDELGRQGQLESVDGLSYLASLDEGLPALPNVDSWTRIVKEKATLRQVIFETDKIKRRALEEDPSEDLLDTAAAVLERVRSNGSAKDGTWVTPYEVAQRGGPALLVPDRNTAAGLKTPWPRLTRMTSGWNVGDLVIVAGRPGTGKSVIAMQQAYTTAMVGIGVAYVSLEMSKESLTRRLVAGISRVDAHEARSGFLDEDQKRRMLEAAADLEGLPLFVADSRAHTPAAVTSALRRLKARTKVGLVIVDHLQLMKLLGRAESRHHELSEICHGFKRLAGQMECVVMLLSQLNRSSIQEKRRPNLADLKETGSIEEDADVVALIHRPEMLNREDQSLRGAAELIIAKQRSGPTGLIRLRFLEKFQVFEPASDSEGQGE